jgi:ABC-type amino acid transport substrate-binding protein
VALACVAVAGCGVTIPTDPDGTLDRVRTDGVVRVGASPAHDWVAVGSGTPSGREPALVEDLAEHLGARVEWVVAGEEHLATLFEDGEIDLAVGGFTEDNVWIEKVGLTRPYVTEAGRAHVWMVPLGENAWQSEVERWLDRQEVPAR